MADDPPATSVFDQAVEQAVETFLAACRTASLATADADGSPHNANVQFVHGPADRAPDEGRFEMWWVSSPRSAHSQHLAQRPQAAVTVYAHADAPDQIHGLQARGTVDPGLTPGDAGYDQALARYAAKYPFVSGPPFDAALAKQALYRFRPDWIRWIDNRRGFGWKVEKTLDDSTGD